MTTVDIAVEMDGSIAHGYTGPQYTPLGTRVFAVNQPNPLNNGFWVGQATGTSSAPLIRSQDQPDQSETVRVRDFRILPDGSVEQGPFDYSYDGSAWVATKVEVEEEPETPANVLHFSDHSTLWGGVTYARYDSSKASEEVTLTLDTSVNGLVTIRKVGEGPDLVVTTEEGMEMARASFEGEVVVLAVDAGEVAAII